MYARFLIRSLIAVGLTACTSPTTYQVTLYYADRDLRVLVPVTRSLSEIPAKLPAAVIEQLQLPPAGLTSVLPTGTTLTAVNRDKGLVSVTLNPPSAGLQGATMVQEALALSLVGLDGIDRIRLYGLPKGETGLDFSQPTGRPQHPNRWLEANEGEGTWVTVAWQLKEQAYLVPVSVPAASDSVAERLQVWKKGPTGSRESVVRGLWPNNHPLSLVGQNGQTVVVRLPQQLPKVAWDPVLRALSWTMTEAPGVEHVQLDGPAPPGVPENKRLDRPQALNATTHS